MNKNGITLSVVVAGNPVTEYPLLKNGFIKTYIEGREGSNYELHVINNTADAVEAVISIDGLSIVDGKQAGFSSTGYILEHGRHVIPGWLVDGNTAAKFAFSKMSDSYAAKGKGDTTNVGVIGIRVFSKNKPITVNTLHAMNASALNTSKSYTNNDFNNVLRSCSTSIGASACSQSIGTEFGEATDFNTKTVAFSRGALFCEMELYYDNAAGLRKRGIDISPEGKRFVDSPSAFPADHGCTPPDGWVKNR